jgi:tartrate/fumarate subfamily iron-sulfur-dependent hydro-lyase beta chain
MAEIVLKTPLRERDVRRLRVGDAIRLGGIVYTARDAAHRYLVEQVTPCTLPFSLAGAALYHCGPLVKKVAGRWRVVVAGPTTSARLSVYTPMVIAKYGVRAIIGKGGMDSQTLDAMEKYGAVYLSAIGGAAVLLAKSIRAVRAVYMLEEFGIPEAFWKLEVEGFPAIVTMDSRGNSLHQQVLEISRRVCRKLIRT